MDNYGGFIVFQVLGIKYGQDRQIPCLFEIFNWGGGIIKDTNEKLIESSNKCSQEGGWHCCLGWAVWEGLMEDVCSED